MHSTLRCVYKATPVMQCVQLIVWNTVFILQCAQYCVAESYIAQHARCSGHIAVVIYSAFFCTNYHHDVLVVFPHIYSFALHFKTGNANG